MDTPPTSPQRSRPPSKPGESSSGVRRRPSGEPPPLPRPVDTATRIAGIGLLLAGALAVVLSTATGTRNVTATDLVVLRALERLRTGTITDLAEALVEVGSVTAFRVLAWAVLAVLLLTRRFEHLFTALVALLTVPVAVATLREAVGRLRPTGVTIAADWEGYAHPSLPVAQLALVLTVVALAIAPPGRWRARAVAGGCVGVLAVVAARLLTAVDHPSDAFAGVALGVAVPVVLLRLVTPEEAFPVAYRRGVRAHLDVGGPRGDAIREAFAQQMDVHVERVEPFSLLGSAGSTPLRISTPTGPLFGKLYASVHLRSDRWYKLARTVRYGRLEDERPYNSVRRLVQHEDHMLRVMRDAGVPTATPHGIVEITPEREYVLVTGFIDGAQEITDCEITDDVIDQSLAIVRSLWDAGLAHRDIKPSNLLVAAGRVWLIDVAFAEVRPSPWRQAVDLANVLLTLSLGAAPARVYERALERFTPDEIAEAFAASRAVTVPAQLRTRLRARGDDPAAQFRALAPPRPPVAIQRWTLRRVGLTLGVLVSALAAAALVLSNLELAGLL